jgi:hypothetical protein
MEKQRDNDRREIVGRKRRRKKERHKELKQEEPKE